MEKLLRVFCWFLFLVLSMIGIFTCVHECMICIVNLGKHYHTRILWDSENWP